MTRKPYVNWNKMNGVSVKYRKARLALESDILRPSLCVNPISTHETRFPWHDVLISTYFHWCRVADGDRCIPLTKAQKNNGE
ncbi:unnamed protein product [Sympodiomycopsis kandeliae]